MVFYLQMIETEEDKSKFEAIYQEYKDLMYYIAFRRLQRVQDAEDAVQYVFMKVAEHIKRIEPVGMRTQRLMATMVDNRAVDMLRAQARTRTTLYDEEVNYMTEQGHDEEGLLADCILRLPEQQRTVIWLKYYHGYSLREIAGMLNISLWAAQKIDQRAKKKLEELYMGGGV